MPPRPPSRSYSQILADSPLLNTDRARSLFPTPEDQRRLEDLSRAIDDATGANQSAAQTWQSLADFKETVIALVNAAVGRPS